MADCEQAYIGEFIYNTYVQEKPMHIESVGPAKERIVRCKDCKHAFDEGSGYLYCGRRPGHCFETRADGFCKWSVRRADG